MLTKSLFILTLAATIGIGCSDKNGNNPTSNNSGVSDQNSYFIKEAPTGLHIVPFLKANGKWVFVDAQNVDLSNKREFDDFGFAKKGFFQVKTNEKWGQLYPDTSIYIEPFSDTIIFFLGDIAPFSQNNKYGAINRNGDQVVNPLYDHLSINNNYATVSLEGKYALLDLTSFQTTPFTYDSIGRFSDKFLESTLDDKNGLISFSGEEYIPPTYDRIESAKNGLIIIKTGKKSGIYDPESQQQTMPYTKIIDFSEKAIAVSKDNKKYYFIGKDGKRVSNIEYDYVGTFGDKLFPVRLNNKYGFVREDGKLAIPLNLEIDGTEGFISQLAKVHKEGRYGYVNDTGNIVIPIEYNYIEDFREGFARAEKGGQWGFVDTSGREITPFIYDYATSFYEGRAEISRNYHSGFIDTTGKEVIEPTYEKLNSFNNGLATAYVNHKWGVIDKYGTPVIPVQYKRIERISGDDNVIAAVGKDYNKLMLVDKQFNIITEAKYRYISTVEKGFIVAGYNDKKLVLNSKGEEINSVLYDRIEILSNLLLRVTKDDISFYVDSNGREYIEKPEKTPDPDNTIKSNNN